MQEKRDDYIAMFLNEQDIKQVHVNPAHGVPLPENCDEFDAVLIYGGIQSANDGSEKTYIADEINWLSNWLGENRPALGICLGAQLIAKTLGATVSRHPDEICEIGFHKITPTQTANGFISAPSYFFQWHSEGFTLPENCELLAEGEQFPNQAFRYGTNTYGIQFHPEVTRSVMKEWLSSGSHMLNAPGAHSAEQQMEDETRFGSGMGKWCRNFVDHWIKTW